MTRVKITLWPYGSHVTKHARTNVFSCLLQAAARRMNVNVHEAQMLTQPYVWALQSGP